MQKTLRLLILTCCFVSTPILAQQGNLDPLFNTFDNGLTGDGFDNTIRTISLQSDGDLIVGGDFLTFNGVSFPYLRRLKPDGTIDPTFDLGQGFNNKVYATAVLPDGKIMVGGAFTAFDGHATHRLLRLNQDGSYDPTFVTTLGSNNIIYDIDLYRDGKAIVVGSFTKYNETAASRVAKILPDGSLDTSFSSGLGANALMEKVVIQSDNKIILGGNFTTFNGQNKNSIVRLNPDGSIDNSFDIGLGFDNKVTDFDLQTDGKIIVVGTFLSYNKIAANRIVRLNPDGTIDSSFQSGTGFDDDTLYTVKVDAQGNSMIGGAFTGTYNGVSVNRLVFLNPNGTLKSDFDIGAGPATASVFTLAKSTDTSWYVGGSFSVFDNQNQGRLAKIDANGALDIGFLSPGVGFDNSVLKILSLENNETMAFGSFSTFNKNPSSRIVRLLENGTSDTTFNIGNTGANNSIRTAALQDDGKIIIGGNFTIYNQNSCNRLARILPNGDFDTTFDIGTAANNTIYTSAILPDQKIIIAGNFTKFNDLTTGRIIRLLPNGSVDTGFDTGLGADAIIDIVVVQPDGKILVAGRFLTFDGVLSPHLVRLNEDGSVDTGFFVETGFDKNVYAIALQSDNTIIVGGSFLNYKGVSQNKIARLFSNGNLDVSFSSGKGFSKGDVRTLLTQADDKILVGGTFSGTFDGEITSRIIRLLPTGKKDPTFVAHLNNTLFTMALSTNHKLMIGGNFNSISGIAKHRIARLHLCTDSSIWDGTYWSRGLPSAGKELHFLENYPTLSTTAVCSCAIDTGKIVTLAENTILSLVYDYSGLGTLVLENGASLYQSDNQITNTGKIHLKRITPPIRRFDYTYWSSAVNNSVLKDVSPETLSDKFLSFNGTNWVYEDKNNNMKNGVGYAIRGPQNYSTTAAQVYLAIFRGVPNNGIINGEVVLEGKKYLAGNPYPSAIDAVAFLEKNPFLGGTIRFWTHNTAIAPSGQLYTYSSDDYASYNALGGVKAQSGGEIPSGKIAAGQAFLVAAIANGTLFFDNSMRVAEEEQNKQFFRPSKTTEIIAKKNRLWINFANDQGAFKQILIGYPPEATNNYDNKFDAVTYDANAFVDFYSTNDNKKLTIQGRSPAFDKLDFIPLGYKTTTAGSFGITIDQIDSFFENKAVFIEDKERQIIHDLKKKAYFFETPKGIFNDRFVLRIDNQTKAIDGVEKTIKTWIAYKNQKQLVVESTTENILKIQVYDLSGKLIFEQENDKNKVEISNLKPRNQVLILKIKTQNSEKTQKILF